MGEQWSISEVQAADLESAWRTWLCTGWNEKYAIDFEEFCLSWQASFLTRCIRDHDSVIAIARSVSDGVLYAMIHDVVVHPDYRGRGMGAQLIQALTDELQARGVRCIQLMAAENQGTFYERLGFRARQAEKPGMEFERRG